MPELISVIVTTYDREDALDAVLRSLTRQSDRGFEVILRVGQQLRDALSAAGESGLSQLAAGEGRLDRRCDDAASRGVEAGGAPIDYVI